MALGGQSRTVEAERAHLGRGGLDLGAEATASAAPAAPSGCSPRSETPTSAESRRASSRQSGAQRHGATVQLWPATCSTDVKEDDMDTTTTRTILERPFDAALIKTRPGSHGKQLSYVEGAEYVRRLNEAFEGQWSFEVVDYQLLDTEVVVRGRLTAGGQVKESFGGHRRADGSELGDDLKAASTDALKKAASLFGVGLHLYTENRSQGGQAEYRTSAGSQGTSRHATSKQLGLVRALAKRLGKDEAWLDRKCLERYSTGVDGLTKAQASKVIDCLNAEIDRRKEAN